MNSFRSIVSALLVALLLVSTGLVSAAHAVPNGCMAAHCVDAASQSGSLHHVENVGERPDGHSSHDTDGVGSERCSAFQCHILALGSKHMDVTFILSKFAWAQSVVHLSTFDIPERLDRPPGA